MMYSKVRYQLQINRELTGTDNQVSFFEVFFKGEVLLGLSVI